MYTNDIMDVIKMMTPMIKSEIHDARDYAMKALQLKEHHPDLADMLLEISEEEMGHMKRLHDGLAKLIEAYRQEKGDPPAPMLAVYDYLHKEQIADAAEVKTLQAMYTNA